MTSKSERSTEQPVSDDLAENYRAERIVHWDAVAKSFGAGRRGARGYHRLLARLYAHLVPKGARVLEIGCGTGDLLAALEPAEGVGIDFSAEMLAVARERHPGLRFVQTDAAGLDLGESFDFIILSDLLNDVFDVQQVLERVRLHCNPRTRVVLNIYSQLWRPVLSLTRALGLARPLAAQNWLTRDDIGHLLFLTGFEPIRSWQDILLPTAVPVVTGLFNRFMGKLWPFRHLCLTNVILARPAPEPRPFVREPVVSVVVAARNEAGNIANILARVPEMGGGTEIVFVEGGSQDNTYETIETLIAEQPSGRCRLFRQPGKGKGDAVRTGFEHARGDILMILDADLTVPPEDLPRFYDALRSGKAEFVNGVRLVYPMQKRAMRFCNLLGNKFFSLAFSWLLGQSVKDTLCGTKVLWRDDYRKIVENRSYFGDFDPFGDFDLIFGAVRQNLKIVDLPVRYRERTYGETNISRWRHGWLLLRMVCFAARRIKFL